MITSVSSELRRSRSRRLPALVALLLLAGSASACTGSDENPPAASGSSTAPAAEAVATAAAALASMPAGFADIPDVVARVDPSVVTVVVAGRGLGSGVVYRTGGIIVTNAHVIAGARQVEVELADGTRVPAQVVAADEDTDLAVLRAERKNLPAATFQPVQPRVGELVMAMGSPLGFQNSVTAGIVSGLGREIPDAAAQGGRALVDLMQTDAAISPGNSGGALVNARGEIVGINEAYIPPSVGAVNLGFAIPAATVIDVVDQLLATGSAVHPYLGVNTTTLTREIAEYLGLAVDEGVLVTGIPREGPATAAGIRPGDVMVAFNDRDVRTQEAFLGELRGVKPGQRVTVKVQRGDETVTLPVTIGRRPTG